MTNEQQRIAIAEASGWVREYSDIPTWDTSLNSYKPVHTMLFRRQEKCFRAENLPDYLNDLNAMHEAERTMGDPQLWVEYQSYLSDVMGHVGWIYHATAAQRAEAFLRTIGK
jgi:hypothetical protein